MLRIRRVVELEPNFYSIHLGIIGNCELLWRLSGTVALPHGVLKSGKRNMPTKLNSIPVSVFTIGSNFFQCNDSSQLVHMLTIC